MLVQNLAVRWYEQALNALSAPRRVLLGLAIDIHSGLLQLWRQLPYSDNLDHTAGWARRHLKDEWAIALIAATVSVAAYLWYDAQGVTVAFNDARIREMIARRVLISRTPGLAQLGITWLPLGSVLMLPLIWNDAMFRNGIAGSVPSMLAFVVASVYIYKLARSVTSSRPAGWLAATVLILNPSLMYMQTTAMSEPASVAALVAAIYYAVRLTQSHSAPDIVKCASAATVGTLIRYENWMLALGVLPVIAYAGWRHRGYLMAEAWSLLYGALAFAGCAAWVLYNWIIFHDPLLSFFYGQTSHSYYGLASDAELPARHQPLIAFVMYGYTIIGTVGWMVAAGAVLGLALFARRHRLRATTLAAYLTLVPFAFYWIVLVAGANTENVPELHLGRYGAAGYYNVRFGLLMIPAAALFAGTVVAAIPRWAQHVVVAFAPVLVVLSTFVGVAVTDSNFAQPRLSLVTPYVEREVLQGDGAGSWKTGQEEAAWFSANYHGGNVLITYPTDPSLIFFLLTKHGFPDRAFITDANEALFADAIKRPAQTVNWIVLNSDPDYSANQLWLVLRDRQDFRDQFVLRKSYGTVAFYERSLIPSVHPG